MTLPEIVTHNVRLKLLSLAAALLLWFFAGLGMETTLTVQVPVELSNLPTTFQVAGSVPSPVEVTLAGPRVRVAGVREADTSLHLDLGGTREGTVAFTGLHKLVKVPAGVEVVRVQPAAIELRILRKAGTW